MCIQDQLNNEALLKLEKVCAVMALMPVFELTQAKALTLRRTLETLKSLDVMSSKERELFENDLIDEFKYKKYI